MNGPWSKAVRPRRQPAFHRLGRAIFELGLREPVATMAKKLDDVAPAQRHVGISRNESPGCGYGALTAEMCSEQFFETLAVHGARSLSTSGCAPSTNAITAAKKRSARPGFAIRQRARTAACRWAWPASLRSRERAWQAGPPVARSARRRSGSRPASARSAARL